MTQAAPIPPDEGRRLDELRSYGLLDTEPQPAFDRLTRLAAEMIGVPIAAVSLVDADRQWFKSKVGITADSTSRDLAFCAHTICQDEPLVVPDATLDPRFADNPLVVGELGVRFYAGAQLTSPLGHRLGALCVIDTTPRQVSPEQVSRLVDLAAAVVTTMELHRTLQELEDQTAKDKLTGLANRGRLLRHVATLLESEAAFVPFSLLQVGCDDLKALNDSMGHEAGDQVLRALGRALLDWIRPADVAARLDWDEFALLLPATRERDAETVAQRVLEHASALMRCNGWPVTLSIGAATFASPPQSAEHALSLADAAMSDARLRGKRQVRVARFPSKPGEPPALLLGVMQQALRTGIERDELFLQYQPIVSMAPAAAGAGQGSVEALVRWRHPTLGVLPPCDFIPGAEKSGLIVPLGDAVLTIALRQMQAWLREGVAPARVSVNVSALQLRSGNFGETVLRQLKRHCVPPDRLMIEITEGVLVDGSGVVLDALHALADGGVKVAIDDFGTGYSSLRYLRDLPVHTLKIDRTFVQDVVGNPRDVSIVAAIIAMAQTLQLTTVAEGIETEAQRHLLAGLGCDYGQGWLFGRPA